IAVWALVALGASVVLARPGTRRWLAVTAVVVAWLTAGALLLVVPDFRVLIRVAYLPVVLLGAPFSWPPGVDLGEFFQWTVLNQFLCVGGGIAFASAALHGQRRL